MTLGLPVDRLIETRKWALDWALNAMGGINNGNVWSVVDAARVVSDYLLDDCTPEEQEITYSLKFVCRDQPWSPSDRHLRRHDETGEGR